MKTYVIYEKALIILFKLTEYMTNKLELCLAKEVTREELKT